MDIVSNLADLSGCEPKNIRYLIAGVILLVPYCGTLYVLEKKAVPLAWALGIAFIVWGMLSFPIQRFWTFESSANVYWECGLFLLKSFGYYLATLFLLHVSAKRIGKHAAARQGALVIATALLFGLDYLANLVMFSA
jgi:putative flippase GtrA